MGTIYEEGFTSGGIGAAVAEAILHDHRGNGLSLQGFPQVEVASSGGDFLITISFGECKTSFAITREEARDAVHAMDTQRSHSGAIFDRVQEAVANLEGAVQRSRYGR